MGRGVLRLEPSPPKKKERRMDSVFRLVYIHIFPEKQKKGSSRSSRLYYKMLFMSPCWFYKGTITGKYVLFAFFPRLLRQLEGCVLL